VIPEPLLARLRDGRRFLVVSHANPDGDAIGTGLGLARAMRGAGHQALVWSRDPVPTVYLQLPGAGDIHVGEDPPPDFPAAFDCAIVLECPTLDRTGLETRLALLPQLNIDHHLGNAGYGEAAWVDPQAPAVAVMVAELLRELRVPIDSDAASCLFVGLSTDTGGFRFANATPRAFRAAADLVAEGASVERVSQWLHESQPEGAVRLLGGLLATLERHGEDGRVATARLTREMFAAAGAAPGDAEGLIDVPRSVAGVDAVGLLREVGDDLWKISLRSRGTIDVEAIARAHGGGGHRNAAGFRIEGGFESARAAVVEALLAATGRPR